LFAVKAEMLSELSRAAAPGDSSRRMMVEYAVSVEIHATPEKVWSELIDVERWPEWTPSMTKIERREAGPFGLGSRARITQPKLPPMIWTVTDFRPGKAFSWTAAATGVTSVGEHELSVGDNQTVTVTLRVRQSGPLAPIVGLLTSEMTKRYVNLESQGLKQRCEASAIEAGA
jgi:hypothetical protein